MSICVRKNHVINKNKPLEIDICQKYHSESLALLAEHVLKVEYGLLLGHLQRLRRLQKIIDFLLIMESRLRGSLHNMRND